MKKFLLTSLLAVLSAAGVWADEYTMSNSYGSGTVTIDGTTATVTVTSSDQGHVFAEWAKANTEAMSNVTNVVFTSGSVIAGADISELPSTVTTVDATGVEFRSGSTITITNTNITSLTLAKAINYDADNTSDYNYKYKNFAVTGCTSLETLDCSEMVISYGNNWEANTLNFSGNTALKDAIFPNVTGYNKSVTLNVSNDAALTGVVAPYGVETVTTDGTDLGYLITCYTWTGWHNGVNYGDDGTTISNVDVRKEGALATAADAIKAAMTVAVDITNVTTTNDVDLDNNDLTALTDLPSTKFNLEGAAFTKDETFKFTNNTVEYLLMPLGIENVSASMFDCSSLKSAVSFKQAYGGENNGLSAYVFTAGELRGSTDLHNSGTLNADSLFTVQVSGNVMFADLATFNTADGHYGVYSETSTNPCGLPFMADRVKTLDLTYAVFTDNSDLMPAAFGYKNNLKNLYLPIDASMSKLPDESLHYNYANLEYLCIPGNYTYIGKNAIMQISSLTHIYTTETAENGNGYPANSALADYDESKIIDNGDNTITISANVTEIQTGAFQTGYEKYSDVYSLAETAPKCYVNAFSEGVYSGWGGYDSGVEVTRESYSKFAKLHYPNTVNDTEKKRYTDVNRVYSIRDAKGATDASGNVIYWPNQIEYNRAYNSAICDILWDNFSNDFTGAGLLKVGSDEEYYHTLTSDDAPYTYWDGKSNTYEKEYVGWHQFVLVDNMATEKAKWNFSRFKKSQWYTVCLPFDCTQEQLAAVLGGGDQTYPDVRELQSVSRNQQTGKITFNFNTDNLCEKGYEWDWDNKTTKAAGTNDGTDKVIMRAGRPYLIHPYMTKENMAKATAGTYLIEAGDFTMESVQVVPLRYDVPAVYVDAEGKSAENEDGSTYTYTFIGTYGESVVPQYAYYISSEKFYYLKAAKTVKWPGYTAIIGAGSSDGTAAKVDTKWGTADGTETGLATESATNTVTFSSDDLGGTASVSTVKTAGMNFDGIDVADGIMEINMGGEDVVLLGAQTKVYNTAGQQVATGTLENLPAGIYIVGTKKVLVK